MKPQLRGYQIDTKDQLRAALKKNKRVIVSLPTGGGKSVIFASIIDGVLSLGGNVLVLVHREELVEQVRSHLQKLGIHAATIAPGHDMLFGESVYIAMAQTFKRRMNSILFQQLKIKLVIVDEVHRGEFRECLKMINCHVAGFTATPKASGKIALHTYFDDIVCPITDRELIDQGYLLSARTYSVEYDFSNLKIKGGEFTDASLLREFKQPKLFDGMLENFKKYAHDKKTICYNCNVEHSLATTELFKQNGIHAVHIDGTTPKGERREIFQAFRRDEFQVLCNVDVATTGNDEPSTECIIENLATCSLTKHRQMIGRGSRPYKDQKEFIILDMGRNYMRHGMYGEFINWRGIFEDPTKDINKKESRKELRACANCDAIIKTKVRTCAYCGYVHSKEEKERHLIGNSTLEEIRDYKIQHLPIELRGLKPSQMTYQQLINFANHMGYDGKWIHVQRKLQRK